MTRLHTALLSVAIGAAISPAAALASTYWHNAAGELSADTVPEHFVSRPTGQVRAELEKSRADGSLRAAQSGGAPASVPQSGRTSTRDDVLRELRATTPAQREALRDIYVGG